MVLPWRNFFPFQIKPCQRLPQLYLTLFIIMFFFSFWSVLFVWGTATSWQNCPLLYPCCSATINVILSWWRQVGTQLSPTSTFKFSCYTRIWNKMVTSYLFYFQNFDSPLSFVWSISTKQSARCKFYCKFVQNSDFSIKFVIGRTKAKYCKFICIK